MPTRGDTDKRAAASDKTQAGPGRQPASDMGRLLKHSSIYMVGGMLNRIGVFLLLPVYTSYLCP